ncbi:hypothetical protein [Streptomyces abyssomicinicus]|uniref:hypothetical protein n=1 Tax=Streptomyces abyssomicinicus TaxID=574929 RepID=UPI00125092DD|nr:hypothetical protein [Streptomyces abyssomicinicus]
MAENGAGRDPDHEEQEPELPAFDEKAAWEAIVASYGEEPPDPPGVRPFRAVEDLALPEEDVRPGDAEGPGGADGPKADAEPVAEPGPEPEPEVRPLGGAVTFAPGVGAGATATAPPAGPRDFELAEPSEEEDHFVPPEPPPLPETDATAKFAWLGIVGGPVLLLLAVLLGWHMSWWLTTVCVGGFLGGAAALVLRMDPDGDDFDDPGRGAVV